MGLLACLSLISFILLLLFLILTLILFFLFSFCYSPSSYSYCSLSLPITRPKGGYEAEFSLAPIAPRLSELLSITVPLVTDCIGPVVTEAISKVVATRTYKHADVL